MTTYDPEKRPEQIGPMLIRTEGVSNSTRPHYSQRRTKRRSQNAVFPIVILAGALFSTFLSPQISLFGGGLRLALPLFLLLGFIVILSRHRVAMQTLRNQGTVTIMGLAFVAMGFLRYFSDPEPTLLHNHVISALVCIGLWIAVIMLRQVFPESVEKIRWIVLITLGVSLGMGISLLIQEPGIARRTMGNPLSEFYGAMLYPKGVANYSWYTPVAFAFPVVANWLYNSPRRLPVKIIGWCLLLAACVAVLFSTFTMAAVMLILASFLWLFLVTLKGKGKVSRLAALIIIVVSLVFLPSLYYLALDLGATGFITAKATRLIEGAFSEGVIDADVSGRTWMFFETMNTFLQHPILGAWGIEPSFFVGGHSSWADTLALQGVLGMLLWVGFLSPSWRRQRPFSVSDGVAGGTLSWILLGLGGILNPTFSSHVGLILLWLFDDGGGWQAGAANK